MPMQASNAAVASNLVSSVTMAGLLRCLVQKGVLAPDDVREIYETALMLLEQQQANLPTRQEAFVAARAVLEDSLQSGCRRAG